MSASAATALVLTILHSMMNAKIFALPWERACGGKKYVYCGGKIVPLATLFQILVTSKVVY